jgi:phytoene dehydrogenase-like protein
VKTIQHTHEFVVVGGGLAGICAAVTAARQGVRTALIQDRPVLGGNASTEIRVPAVGANQCNFAYSRETGLIEELFLNNLYRNPTWCPEGWNLELENRLFETSRISTCSSTPRSATLRWVMEASASRA